MVFPGFISEHVCTQQITSAIELMKGEYIALAASIFFVLTAAMLWRQICEAGRVKLSEERQYKIYVSLNLFAYLISLGWLAWMLFL